MEFRVLSNVKEGLDMAMAKSVEAKKGNGQAL